MHRKGIIFVISAPSGSGKTTICEKLLKCNRNIKRSISYTTRKPRPDEKHSRDYYFVSKSQFLRLIRKNFFIEWEKNFGFLYGTPIKPLLDAINSGKDVILSIDVKGAQKIKKAIKESVHIFIKPPSLAELKRRLIKRKTDTTQAIKKRLSIANKEIQHEKQYDYVVINNQLEKAVKKIFHILKKERHKRVTTREV